MKFVASALAPLLLIASACGSSYQSDDHKIFREAVERTLAAECFHLSLETGGTESSLEADYVAPDRFLFSGSGRLGGTQASVTTIIVGTDRYISEPEDISKPEDAKRFFEASLPCAVGLGEYLVPSGLREAQEIRRVGATYTFGIDALAEGARGSAQISAGRLVSLSIRFMSPRMGDEPMDLRYSFSDYGTPIPIDPPPRRRVVGDYRFGELPLQGLTGSALPCP
jgi:hypothetical protein